MTFHGQFARRLYKDVSKQVISKQNPISIGVHMGVRLAANALGAKGTTTAGRAAARAANLAAARSPAGVSSFKFERSSFGSLAQARNFASYEANTAAVPEAATLNTAAGSAAEAAANTTKYARQLTKIQRMRGKVNRSLVHHSKAAETNLSGTRGHASCAPSSNVDQFFEPRSFATLKGSGPSTEKCHGCGAGGMRKKLMPKANYVPRVEARAQVRPTDLKSVEKNAMRRASSAEKIAMRKAKSTVEASSSAESMYAETRSQARRASFPSAFLKGRNEYHESFMLGGF